MEGLSPNSGICVVYEKGELSAERMRLVKPIIRKYIMDNGIRLDRNNVYFVGLSRADHRKPRLDYKKLKKMACCARVFVTQLNSSSCQYLQTIFFDTHPETVLISSVSTATSLSGVDNLLRYQISDAQIQKVYLYNIQKFGPAPSNNCIIIYEPGVYYEDLTRAIADATASAGISTLLQLKANFNLAQLNLFADDVFTIVFVVDDPLFYIDQLRLDPTINTKSFQILISDSGTQQLTNDPIMLAYLQRRETQLLQFFVNPSQLLLALEYEAYINNPRHPVSPNVAFLLACFDWGVLVTNTATPDRLRRSTYLNLYLDPRLDNINAIYGGYKYIPDSLRVQTFYYIYGAVLYVGASVNTLSGGSLNGGSLKKAQGSDPSTSRGFCYNVGLCVLYDTLGFAAERSFEVKRIVAKYIADTGTKIRRNRLKYLAITGESTIDNANLTRTSRDARVFVSALGSGRCSYLAQTFFDTNLDCLHLNSFSTAAALSPLPNLARYQTPDITIVKVYLYQIQRLPGNCVIVYGGGIYSTGLSLEILKATTAAGIETLRILQTDLTPAILNEFTTDYFSIVYILDEVLSQIEILASDPLINQKTFQILVSDSAALDTTSDPALLTYLNQREARLIQTFVSARQLELATIYEASINNPDHPVSPIVAFFLACFDWGLLVTNTTDCHRLTRRTYLDLELDMDLNNKNTVYGAYRYVPGGLAIATFYFVYADLLYVGIDTRAGV
jgi:hypothetical protein